MLTQIYCMLTKISPMLQSLKCSTFPLERWANCKWTVNVCWTKAKWTMSERWTQVGERYVWTLNDEMSKRWMRTERKRKYNENGERTLNVLFGKSRVFLTSNFVRVYMHELLNFEILFKHIYVLYKSMAWNRNYL